MIIELTLRHDGNHWILKNSTGHYYRLSRGFVNMKEAVDFFLNEEQKKLQLIMSGDWDKD